MNMINVDFFEEYQYHEDEQFNSLVSLETEANDNDGNPLNSYAINLDTEEESEYPPTAGNLKSS